MLQARRHLSVGHQLGQPPRSHRACFQRCRCSCLAAPQQEGTVRLTFNLPYHCNFGQQLMIVGSEERLGSWNVHQGVPMMWSEGDVWRADLEVPANASGTHLEYKYVVRESDGTIVAWKPGDNYYVRIPLEEQEPVVPRMVRISDAWDGLTRDIEAEGELEFSTADDQAAAVRPLPKALTFEEGQPLDEVAVVAQAAERAMQELDKAISHTVRLLDNTSDPTSSDVLAADRAVAAAARRAVAMTKALQVADPSYTTKLLTNKKGELVEIPDDFEEQLSQG